MDNEFPIQEQTRYTDEHSVGVANLRRAQSDASTGTRSINFHSSKKDTMQSLVRNCFGGALYWKS